MEKQATLSVNDICNSATGKCWLSRAKTNICKLLGYWHPSKECFIQQQDFSTNWNFHVFTNLLSNASYSSFQKQKGETKPFGNKKV